MHLKHLSAASGGPTLDQRHSPAPHRNLQVESIGLSGRKGYAMYKFVYSIHMICTCIYI